MRSPYLVTVLSGGLRQGKGHITLVSDPSALSEAEMRLPRLTALAPWKDGPIIKGTDYLGVCNEASVQTTSNRIAPEMIIVFNLRVSALSEERQADLIARLRARLDLLSELRDDCPPRATRTTLHSPTLMDWLRVERFDELPADQVGSPQAEEPVGRGSGMRVGVLAVCLLGLLGGGILAGRAILSGGEGVSKKISIADQKPIPAEPKDRHELLRREWYENLEAEVTKNLDAPPDGKYDSLVESLGQFQRALDITADWPREERSRAEAELRKNLDAITAKLQDQIALKIDVGLKRITTTAPRGVDLNDGNIQGKRLMKELKSLGLAIQGTTQTLGEIEKVSQYLSPTISRSSVQASADSSSLRPDENSFGKSLNQLSTELVLVFDSQLQRLVELEPNFLSALGWLQATAQSPELMTKWIKPESEKRRVAGGLTVVKPADGDMDSRWNLMVDLKFKAQDYTPPESCKIDYGYIDYEGEFRSTGQKKGGLRDRFSSEVKSQHVVFRFSIPFQNVNEPGRLVLRPLGEFEEPLEFNLTPQEIRRVLKDKVSSPISAVRRPPVEFDQAVLYPDSPALVSLQALRPFVKKGSQGSTTRDRLGDPPRSRR